MKEDQNTESAISDSPVGELDESNSEAPEVNSNESELESDNDSGDGDSNSSDSDFTADQGDEQHLEDENADSEEPTITPEEEIERLKDQNLRLAADMDNLRRRTDKEKQQAHQFAVASFAKELLDVSDNLMRAIQTVPEESRENADSNLKSLLDGVEMTERGLQNVLSRHGISKIDPMGEKFDPHFHEAMLEVTDSDAPNNTIVQVFQPGYKIGERMLRPAMVGVAKTTEKKNGK